MLCEHCREQIELGEALKEEPSHTPGKSHYFHLGCHIEWKFEKNSRNVDEHLHRVQLAGMVH